MSAHDKPAADAPLDLSRWRKAPNLLLAAGGVLAVVGWIMNPQQFGYSWLFAYMFYLSVCLGALFLVLVHHLFDASWSVPIRRVVEHLACLAGPVMAALFIPIAVLAPKIYEWMRRLQTGEIDHSLHAKQPLFSMPMFYLTAVGCFVIWFVLSHRLRYWSLKQDESGAAGCTYKMRFLGVCPHAHAGGDHVDEGASARMVLHDVWRLVFRRQRLGYTVHRLPCCCHPETAGAVARRGAGKADLLHRLADAGLHCVLGLHQL
ncbi:MAG: hypothetical protein DME18_08345 [Verrucomicrobia bacterium]|nr:MAG: hypothetical protein DME18_08345 [Verrucomicrobiota bacterium]